MEGASLPGHQFTCGLLPAREAEVCDLYLYIVLLAFDRLRQQQAVANNERGLT